MTMREKSVLNFAGTSATLQHLPVYHELICCKYKIVHTMQLFENKSRIFSTFI